MCANIPPTSVRRVRQPLFKWPMVTETPESTQLLQWRIEELEAKVRDKDLQIATERDLTNKAKRKVKQLLAKLAERDEALEEMRIALETAARAGRTGVSDRRGSRRKEHDSNRKNSSSLLGQMCEGVSDNNLVVQERAEIVGQLEGHLTQMRSNLMESEREVAALECHRRTREDEWKNSSDNIRTVENTQVHWKSLSLINQQVQEKRRFSAELTRKTRDLEEQVAQQKSLIDGFVRYRSGSVSSHSFSSSVEPALHSQLSLPRQVVASTPSTKNVCEDEALRAFLQAAGSSADPILGHRSLMAAFEERPPKLTADALEYCPPQNRVQVLSLFAAWVAVAADPPAMHLEEVDLKMPEVVELTGALESCCAQLEEWDMTRCPTNDATFRVLFTTLSTQALRRLNLGYNALGPTGAATLVGFAGGWTSSLEYLGLEMNGLGDGGCREVASAIETGLLPKLQILELGWNELSAASASSLVALVRGSTARTCDLFQLRKLGLGGNRLGSNGASNLALAALANPSCIFEVDLSMNHVNSEPLLAMTKWAADECDDGLEVSVSINLEWNNIDDVLVVEELVRSLNDRGLRPTCNAEGQPQSVVRLGNNELENVDPAQLFEQSGGLVCC